MAAYRQAMWNRLTVWMASGYNTRKTAAVIGFYVGQEVAAGGCESAFWEVGASSMAGNGRECGFFGSARLLIGGFADFSDFGAVMVEETSSGVVGERS